MKPIVFILTLLIATPLFAADEVKEADLAGTWYPASKPELQNLLQGYLDAANPEKVDGRLFAIISPHAGYQFSGPVAAYGFKLLEGKDIKTVIVIGFTHRKAFEGISVYDRGVFQTPLGNVNIDTALAGDIIAQNKRIFFYAEAFDDENSVETEIPFIQLALKDTKIVPIAFGGQSFDDARILADALAKVLADKQDCLIVASTDMSHYHPYDEANSIDKHTILLLSGMKTKDLYDNSQLRICELCGIMPVTATLLAAEKLGYNSVKILKYANSGDTSGSKDNVVGYVSAAIYGENSKLKTQDSKLTEGDSPMLNEAQRKRLLTIARESITSFVRDGKRKEFKEGDPILNEHLGGFVTLHEDGELKGCIGNMIGRGPLYQTIADMAIEAATGDPRFRPLSSAEIDRIDLEISVLSPMKRVASYEEVKIPGHGVLVKRGYRSGVYLPQVATEAGWNREEFLTSLCGQKAGFSPDAWKDPATEIYIFTAEVFGEKDLSKSR